MRKSKNRYFYHIFVSPGDAPGAITLNVVWMEREFDAYKLFRCMCPSNYNRFWDTGRYWSKIVNFFIPLAFDAPVTGVPVGIAPPRLVWKKPEWLGYHMVKKFRRYLYSFWCNSRTWQTGRQTDGHRMPAIAALCIASHGKNCVVDALGYTYVRAMRWRFMLLRYLTVISRMSAFSSLE